MANKMILIPKPATFNLKYRNKRGEIKNYKISTPIEKTHDAFVAYAFGRGVRSFKLDQVLEIE